jgi:uncharacterized protein YoaH (UPF0181 family)
VPDATPEQQVVASVEIQKLQEFIAAGLGSGIEPARTVAQEGLGLSRQGMLSLE